MKISRLLGYLMSKIENLILFVFLTLANPDKNIYLEIHAMSPSSFTISHGAMVGDVVVKKFCWWLDWRSKFWWSWWSRLSTGELVVKKCCWWSGSTVWWSRIFDHKYWSPNKVVKSFKKESNMVGFVIKI